MIVYYGLSSEERDLNYVYYQKVGTIVGYNLYGLLYDSTGEGSPTYVGVILTQIFCSFVFEE